MGFSILAGAVVTDIDLPAGLLHAGNDAIEAKFSKADATDFELPINSPRTPTQGAAVFEPGAKLGFSLCFGNFRFAGHILNFLKSCDFSTGLSGGLIHL